MTTPVGIVVHHTASSAKASESNVIAMCIRGVAKVPGPLYNYLIGRDGTVYSLALDGLKANHAGRGNKSVLDRMMKGQPVLGKATTPGQISANARLFGVSIINDGLGQDIPAPQYEACVAICASLCDEHNISPLSGVIGHSEWTSRKVDPTFDMAEFRQQVVSRTSQVSEVARLVVAERPDEEPALVSALTTPKDPGGVKFPGTLRRGSRSEAVKLVQRRIGSKPDGVYGRRTQARVKLWQREWNKQRPHTSNALSVDGVVGPMTWKEMNFRDIDLTWAPNSFFS
tara:strand:+ start:1098 stop:1952 length:855 start_codon:yes stop_codon:yes gene_type:complete